MKKQALKTLYYSVYNIHYHLVLVTKYRRRCITPEVAAYLESQYKRLLKSWDCELLECNGEPDHLHLLISANPKMQPSKMVNSLKTATSRLVRKEFSEHLGEFYWKPVFYSRSYCLVSCGGAPLEIVKQYLAQQEGFD
ncbi:IS200/IS605 family transposase [Pseudoalteromonas nigrifaciens]|uniref:IS200/IS605 family transposase n=1 Tax=Pseudoalteromonas nigrifaciens TaxID=28109 RepID=UPI000B77E48E|nr:IS200/IS605 family transposase [Pseudoalteromonas nigrifaciens]SUD23970.1 Transposase and inactivated derivatives [Pseudoalteromonas nigrifaciens]